MKSESGDQKCARIVKSNEPIYSEKEFGMDDAALKIYLDEWERLANKPNPEAVDELCDVYLAANSVQREQIRMLFDDNSLLRRVFSSYFRRVHEQLQYSGDVRWLKRGLAEHSIEDNRYDWRDVLVGLSKLWLNAEAVGIDPSLYFAEVAAMSSSTPLYDVYSMQGLMAGLETSACLADMRADPAGYSAFF